MFSIGFFEILVIAVLGLLVFGPEKLPDAIRSFVRVFSRLKRSINKTKNDLEQELGINEIRQEIRNAEVMERLEKLKNNPKLVAEDLMEGSDESKESEQLSDDAAETANSLGSDELALEEEEAHKANEAISSETESTDTVEDK